MPSGTYQLQLNVPIQQVWDFISDVSNWAPLVPGYEKHERHSFYKSTWTLKSRKGIFRKSIQIKVEITEWKEPMIISFLLTGVDENVKGEGTFQANVLESSKTEMTGHLNIVAKGIIAPMINPILNQILPIKTKELTERIAMKLTERSKLRKVSY